MISYAPLFETMKKRGVTSYRLERMGFSRATYYSIKQGNSVSTNTIDQLCTLLHCTVGEVMEFIEPEGDNLGFCPRKLFKFPLISSRPLYRRGNLE